MVVYHVRCGNGGQHFDDVVYFPKRDRRTLGSLYDVVSARVSGDFRHADRGQRYRVLYMGKEKTLRQLSRAGCSSDWISPSAYGNASGFHARAASGDRDRSDKVTAQSSACV